METEERFIGCLMGLAVGDALGTTLEFKRPGTFEPITDIIGGGPFRLKAGQWTDDTSMALCLAESLVQCKGFDAKDQMDRYCRWYREGYLSSTGECFDIGRTTCDALGNYLLSGNPYSGSINSHTAGNGSLMRLAPVPLYFATNPELAVHYCGESSRTTHGAAEAVDACRFYGMLIVGALNGVPRDVLLSGTYEATDGFWERQPLSSKIAEVASGSYKRKSPPLIKGAGYVVDSMEAALWAFYNSTDFRDGALLAVNLGDDADTTGAIYGQLAGAYYGVTSIPRRWIDSLAQKAIIEEIAKSIFKERIQSENKSTI